MSGNRLYTDPVLAASYARVTSTNLANDGYERPAVRALLGDVSGRDVLDAGCAAGDHSAWLAERGARVTALDASATMVALARDRLGSAARVVHADLARPLPLAGASFDLVLSSLTLHYLADWRAPLRELARVLRPGGRLVLSTHHPLLTANAVDDYFAVALVEEQWSSFTDAPETVRFYHRPFQAIVGDVLAAGFGIASVHEPRPVPGTEARDPALAERFRTQPGFLILEASVPAR